MRFFRLFLLFIFAMVAFHLKVVAQTTVSLKVTRQEKITPFYGHAALVDRRVHFILTNNSAKPIVVYGTVYEGKLGPTGYLLKFDKEKNLWTYPTSDNKPLEWKQRSSVSKDIVMICPNESLDFNSLFSTETDSKFRYKATVYISLKKGGKPIEIISPEFSIEK